MIDLFADLPPRVLELLEAATVLLKFLSALLGLLLGTVVAVRRIRRWVLRRRSAAATGVTVDPAGSSHTQP